MIITQTEKLLKIIKSIDLKSTIGYYYQFNDDHRSYINIHKEEFKTGNNITIFSINNSLYSISVSTDCNNILSYMVHQNKSGDVLVNVLYLLNGSLLVNGELFTEDEYKKYSFVLSTTKSDGIDWIGLQDYRNIINEVK